MSTRDRTRAALLASLLAFVASFATPGGPPAAVAAPPDAATVATLDIPFTLVRLDNGLELIVHEDHALPLVAVNLWYHVGPVNEPPHRSGFAHLFEHLMFEGSRNVGKRFDSLLESAGATNVNGTTSWDRTDYFETVPREHLELALWIESDRMGFLLENLTQERLDVQRGVVKNERRQSYENAPYGPSELALDDLLFPEGHPYHGAVIGSMDDLSAASLEDVKAFFTAFYTPSNCTIALAGDVTVDEARRLVRKYFGSLPDRPRAADQLATTPPLGAAVRKNVVEPVDLAKVSLGFLAPPAYSSDAAALEVAAAVLAGGKATRLYRTLVVQQKLASDVSASVDANALASMFEVSAVAASGKSERELEAALVQVLAELASKGPTRAELERARRRLLLGLMTDLERLNGRGGESGRAGWLQRFNHYLGYPGHLGKWQAALAAASAEDVRRVVHSFLSPEHCATVVTIPAPKAEERP